MKIKRIFTMALSISIFSLLSAHMLFPNLVISASTKGILYKKPKYKFKPMLIYPNTKNMFIKQDELIDNPQFCGLLFADVPIPGFIKEYPVHVELVQDDDVVITKRDDINDLKNRLCDLENRVRNHVQSVRNELVKARNNFEILT